MRCIIIVRCGILFEEGLPGFLIADDTCIAVIPAAAPDVKGSAYRNKGILKISLNGLLAVNRSSSIFPRGGLA